MRHDLRHLVQCPGKRLEQARRHGSGRRSARCRRHRRDRARGRWVQHDRQQQLVLHHMRCRDGEDIGPGKRLGDRHRRRRPDRPFGVDHRRRGADAQRVATARRRRIGGAETGQQRLAELPTGRGDLHRRAGDDQHRQQGRRDHLGQLSPAPGKRGRAGRVQPGERGGQVGGEHRVHGIEKGDRPGGHVDADEADLPVERGDITIVTDPVFAIVAHRHARGDRLRRHRRRREARGEAGGALAVPGLPGHRHADFAIECPCLVPGMRRRFPQWSARVAGRGSADRLTAAITT